MKRISSVSPMVLCILYVLFPLCRTVGFLCGYDFALRSDPISIAVLAAVSGIVAVLLTSRRQPLSKAQLVFSALLPPLSAINGLFFVLDSGRKATVVFALICFGCSIAILVKSACRLLVKLVSAISSVLLVVVLLFSAWITLVFGDLGVKTVVKSVTSPQNIYTAEVIDSDQGALGGDTHVDVWNNGKKADLLFCRISKSPLRVYTGAWGEVRTMRISWKEEHVLVINGREYEINA